MNKILKALIIVEVQIVIALLIFGLFKLNSLEQKVYNTNKFIHELLTDKRTEELKQIGKHDLIVGDETAPVTMLIFSRFGCSACSSFYKNIYPRLRDEYVNSGLLKIVVRQMVHSSKPKILYASKAALFANKKDVYEDFNYQIHSAYPLLNKEFIDNTIFSLVGDSKDYAKFMEDPEIEKFLLESADQARKAGIKGTPSFLIGDEKIYGTHPYKQFKKIINSKLNSESCDQ